MNSYLTDISFPWGNKMRLRLWYFLSQILLCVVLSVKCLRGLTVRLNFMLKFSLIVSRTKMLYKLDLNPILRKKKSFCLFPCFLQHIFICISSIWKRQTLCYLPETSFANSPFSWRYDISQVPLLWSWSPPYIRANLFL